MGIEFMYGGAIAAFFALGLFLIGCASSNTMVNPKVHDAVVTADVYIQRDVIIATNICQRSTPILQIASTIPIPQVTVVLIVIQAMCGPLIAGVVPATFDANTVSWLERNLSHLLAAFPR